MTEENPKKKRYWFIGLIVLVLLIGGFINYKYIQNATRADYIRGGSDALQEIIETAKLSGGVTLETEENETIILARYDKALAPVEVDNTNYTVQQTANTNTTETNSSA
jgi:hypothetical protein